MQVMMIHNKKQVSLPMISVAKHLARQGWLVGGDLLVSL